MMEPTVSGDQLRAVVGTFPSGITVVTVNAETGADIGLTISAFSSLSLEPAMVVFSVDSNSRSLPHLEVGAFVGISVLAEGQAEIASRFARRGIDRFEGVETIRDEHGPMLIDGAAAWFVGAVVNAFEGGDHTILTVEVHACGANEKTRPLLYQRGRVHDWAD
ncbi:flavin reductase family protein [Corynebacterium alimapuense]|uniref:Flavin reductase n=1 Tax=Corynebacterium alimapuense TaxID=1576874 RepID=A0A3M8K576_9CORY|nr:flavin reductase family protein [Corynebacterium alimapuense]RNE48346.1 flavin reductase [Corynebacterium alimapuense]